MQRARRTRVVRGFRAAVGTTAGLAAGLAVCPLACAAPGTQAASLGVTDVTTMLASLAAVVGLIFAVAYVLRRTPLASLSRAGGPLKIVATLPLGPKERLLLVEARGTELLIAVGPAGIARLGATGAEGQALEARPAQDAPARGAGGAPAGAHEPLAAERGDSA